MATTAKHRRLPWTRPCNCPLNGGQETYQYSVLGIEFRLNQELVRQHCEDCIYRGIPRKKKRTLQAEFPIMFGQFLGRLNRACVEYTVGTSRPGISLRFTNIVPKHQSPLFPIFYSPLGYEGGSRSIYDLSSEEFLCRLKIIENTVLSLYRDGKSSPWDLTEIGDSHETVSRIPPQPGRVPIHSPVLKLTFNASSYFSNS